MLKALQFVKGAVSAKGFSPELTHFKIGGGFILGFNGKIALCSPIELDIEVTPKATPFIKAIMTCKATTAMHITKTGKLSIKSGKFKAFIENLDETFPDIQPEGDRIVMKGNFIQHLKTLAPFMADDASRPWSRGILLNGKSARVTNNIVLIEAWLDDPFPVKINLPAAAVKELVRIKEEPIEMSVSERTVTFFYGDGRWLRSNLNSTEDWPDISRVLDADCSPAKLPEGFFEAVEDIAPFVGEEGRIYLTDAGLKTDRDDIEGASVAMDGLPEDGCFNHIHLAKIGAVVETIDFVMYPAPCIFYGHNLRGAIVGMRS